MPCVLIVEDDTDVREFMDVLLTTHGFETMTAANGREALERMRARRPCSGTAGPDDARHGRVAVSSRATQRAGAR